ncbi:MAG: DNA polymerase III subunit alpha [Epulopiscium sp. Nuni2H_MBin001]|nr:MAG: DNA polymerase III subunit alpha [Epulopiscium sp. Nuni2H_MBin001]
MSAKPFFEVLPELVVEKNLHVLFERSSINNVEFNKSNNHLIFYVVSSRLVSYCNEMKMTQQIKDKLFPTSDINIEINLSYDLPEDYCLERITTEYKDSIIDSLRDNKLIFYLFLKNTEWEISKKTIIIKSPPNRLPQAVFNELKSYLSNVYKTRFNEEITCELNFIEVDETDIEHNELKLSQEIQAIMDANRECARTRVKPMDQLESSRTSESTYKPRQKINTEGLIYGRECEGEPIAIEHIVDEIGEVVVKGKIIDMEMREIRGEKTIIICDITDFTDTITFKIFVDNTNLAQLLAELEKGKFYKVKAMAMLDKYDKEISLSSVKGIKKMEDFTTARVDNAKEKRVELHLHTKMSDMDAVVDIKALINRAKQWGMPALAITDHGCLQAFPIANHCISKDDPFKIIYGIEAYFIEHDDSEVKQQTYHGIILVKNEIGRVNLNRLVSISHLNYFKRRPRMPKSLINQYREGLIIGSACEAGEIFQALIAQKDEAELEKLVEFYDYLEIQPELNNEFMIRSEKFSAQSTEDLRNYNRKIVALGEKYNKMVVATCDVHFLDPQDEVYRRIIMSNKGFKDADFQPPLYFRTTDEMLAEFAYLGEDKAYEVVVTNTRLVADKIEKISPVLPDKCPPEIPNSDKELTEICYNKAHEIYGPDLHPIVVERLERELNSIISNGFAVMYIISQKIVWDSNDHGYLVGSRGSVGSSFAATMSGITEVNPLAPHYICPNCYFTDFESDIVKSFAGSSGCDMPDANCPKCNTLMLKEGHDIPFETFLGFKGDKEPDIDLNFSGEYQAAAHKYVEVLFGEGKAYRAGTIGTMADKTALAYVYKYFEERGTTKRKAEMRRLASGCTGVKRTTGQHPGGIIVVPHDREIYEFCAIQRPANDVNTPIITTHYEYHSIDHNLLKLDILGHDDPTIIRRLEDLTGISSSTIKLDDKNVMALFHGTEILKIKPEDIGGIKLGSLGVPEFGTDFVIQMLVDAKPQNFSDLVRISGLSHGTDVWLGNAQTLIEEGKATISTVICTRDDIMTYLINQGLEKGLAFTIMESVRKGKGLKAEWEEEMIAHDVPDWYIWSCKKIKYMFPKAHAAAYVMMAWRIAWYKVFEPLAYYTAFFSIRASSFSYETMCFGKAALENHMKELISKGKDGQTAKEQDTIKDMRIVQEMYARGFEFVPIDLMTVHSNNFQIIDGKIMPSLATIDGLGDKAAEAVENAAKCGEFLSKDDFKTRTKVSQTLTDKMYALGVLGNVPESNQISFMDIMK